MSQKVSRKTAVNEDKDKRNTESPVKEMKKKMAANAEKEKQAAEKADKADKADKSSEKVADKPEKTDKAEKLNKSADKKAEKKEHADKKAEKKDHADKKDAEKKNEKPEQQAEKSTEENSKEDKSAKTEKDKPEPKKAEPSKQKQNGRDRVHNGVSDVTLGNGTDDVLNGTVSADSEDDDVMLVIDDHDHDELFPELTYDDTSDVECFEPPTPENAPSRSFTRRSQVKATRTPETPRPASDKQTDRDADDPKDSKVLKLKEDTPASTDRKLRSADSPKPESKKQDSEKKQESSKKDGQEKEESKDVVGDKNTEESKSQKERSEMEVIVEVEVNEGEEVQRKTDTNYSKSRVKVSPYRRSMRLADQTNTSLLANYTGNNTTMEMDITESSSLLEDNLDDSAYLRGLRSIRGRSSYKPLKEISLRHVANRSARSTTSATVGSPAPEHSRPTGTVVGRKRKPDHEESPSPSPEPGAEPGAAVPLAGGSKRMRVLERLTEPFRRVAAVTLTTGHRRNSEIVGINTDLPLTAPVSAPATFDPESLKGPDAGPLAPHGAPLAAPLAGAPRDLPDNKRCIVMLKYHPAERDPHRIRSSRRDRSYRLF